tara:strand:+ start:921 stop:1097 length:177 start_codon:yes stop_codon:yes gene_type:complete
VEFHVIVLLVFGWSRGGNGCFNGKFETAIRASNFPRITDRHPQTPVTFGAGDFSLFVT